MKTATVRALRNEFGRLSKWLKAGETIRIVKRGKPFARLVPELERRSFLGVMKGTATIPADLDDPLPVKWEAAD